MLLSFLKLTNVTRVNPKANIFFGIFTLLWSTFWLDEMIMPQSLSPQSVIYAALHFLQFLVPITFYLSIVFYTNPNFKFTPKHLWHLFPPLLFLMLLVAESKISEQYLHTVYIVLFLANSLFYTLAAYAKIQKHQKDIEQFHSSTEDIDLRWIKYIIYTFISAAILTTGYNIITGADPLNVYINIFFLAVVYLVAFYSMRQKAIYPQGISLEEVQEDAHVARHEEKRNQKTKLLSDSELEFAKQSLLRMMAEEQPYLDSELNLIKLAQRMEISTHQLSYLINTGLGTNFFNFINQYRVTKAQELLVNKEYDHLNMLVIGYESGFNSKTSFNTTFKKITSLTPSEYRNQKKRS